MPIFSFEIILNSTNFDLFINYVQYMKYKHKYFYKPNMFLFCVKMCYISFSNFLSIGMKQIQQKLVKIS